MQKHYFLCNELLVFRFTSIPKSVCMKLVRFFSLLILVFSYVSVYGGKNLKMDGFVFIPSGTFVFNETTYAVAPFFMVDHEVTNGEYLLFLNDLLQKGRKDDYLIALPDTAAWYLKDAYLVRFVDYYFRHPAYSDYPVVNVSIKGAELYCAWLTEQLTLKYGKEKIQKIRIPTQGEWIYAANAGIKGAAYSWGTNFLTNEKGDKMANYLVIGDEFITRKDTAFEIMSDYASWNFSAEYYSITAPSVSYFKNDFGLYNMCGNVSELVVKFSDKDTYIAVGGNWNSTGFDIRITSEIPYEKPNPYTGFRPVMTYMN